MISEFMRAFFSHSVVLRACRVASVVAPILLFVNHSESVRDSPFGAGTLRFLGLDLIVPSYSSARTASAKAPA